MTRLASAGGLEVREQQVAIAHLAARHPGAALDERIAALFGLQLPQGPRLSQAGRLKLLGISPGRWLALRESADHDFCADLAAQLRDTAAVCDLSDAYTVLQLRGAAVRPTLAKLIAIDLHERAFSAGQVAATVAAHMPVMLWRPADEDGTSYGLAVAGSYTRSLREALDAAAAEFQRPGAR